MTTSKSSAGASEAARAVNAFLGFSSNDQQALLEVIEDYFTSPDNEDDDDDLGDDDSCMPSILEGAVT